MCGNLHLQYLRKIQAPKINEGLHHSYTYILHKFVLSIPLLFFTLLCFCFPFYIAYLCTIYCLAAFVFSMFILSFVFHRFNAKYIKLHPRTLFLQQQRRKPKQIASLSLQHPQHQVPPHDSTVSDSTVTHAIVTAAPPTSSPPMTSSEGASCSISTCLHDSAFEERTCTCNCTQRYTGDICQCMFHSLADTIFS